MKGSAVILEKNGKFLLQLRSNIKKISYPNMWGLFGGGRKQNETPEQTAIREIKEELNLDLIQNKLKLLLINSEGHHIFRYFKDIKNSKLELNEGQEMKFFSPKEILNLKNKVPGLGKLIENLKKFN
jgi:8-oxo-dGTP pyrophosphatase MutT (NUDIX family)